MDKTRMGLTPSEVKDSRREHGENRFSAKKQEGFLTAFLRGFTDPLILILLAALFLNLLFVGKQGDFFESAGIGIAVFLSVFVSTVSEHKSQKAFQKLSEQQGRATCRVRRDGKEQEVLATELVVGDVVVLSAGDTVPADGHVLFGEMGIDQSTLNGESREARKHPSLSREGLEGAGELFSASVVASGEGEMQVDCVGDATLYGRLAQELQEHSRKSPLKEKLSALAKTLSRLGYLAAFLLSMTDLIYALYDLGGGSLSAAFRLVCETPEALFPLLLHALTLAVTVVVVAVPEGLPMMITVVLSSQMRRMQKEQVLLKKLSGIETAGNMDLLFCDKTGTLTEGAHSVEALYAFDGVRLCAGDPDRRRLAAHLVTNNRATIKHGKIVSSNATDRALLSYAKREGLLPLAETAREYVPFDSARKYSAAEVGGTVYVKGAPEEVILRATHVKIHADSLPLTDALRGRLFRLLTEEENRGARMIAFAEGEGTLTDHLPTRLTLLGFAALSDRLRTDTRATVERLQQAGVQIVMLTGDAGATARAIATRAGILKAGGTVLSSRKLKALTDEEVTKLLPRLCVIYRCTPSDKSRLATLASRSGRVCGMTGDGVNDAPALKLSDVGFAMGGGTQLAKDAADVVILDDRLSSLARAVLYGRTVTRSIRKFLTFQLTMNFSAVLISFLGPFLGIDTPITVLQMLWINLIMDTLASLAFSGEAPREQYMTEKPMKRSAPILSREVVHQILFGTLFTILVCGTFLASDTLRALYSYAQSETAFLSAFFLLFVLTGAFNMLNVRTPRLKLWAELNRNAGFIAVFCLIVSVQILLVYFGSVPFRCAPLPLPLLTLPLLLALSIVPFDLLRKGIGKRK